MVRQSLVGVTASVRASTRELCQRCYARLRRGRPLGARGNRRGHIHDELVDDVVVERLLSGGCGPDDATWEELHAAIGRLDRQGLSAREIASRLDISLRTVVRHRAAKRTTTVKGAAS